MASERAKKGELLSSSNGGRLSFTVLIADGFANDGGSSCLFLVSPLLILSLILLAFPSSYLGLSGALETLCGQAYGAEQYKKFGSYVFCGAITMIPVCIPISILWIFMGKLLISIGLDPQISRVPCKYSIGLIPALFGYAILQSLIRYFQTQSLIFPLLVSSCETLLIHIPLSWALIYKWELGVIGGAISVDVSYSLGAIFLASYMKFSASCEKTRFFCRKDVFSSICVFWRFALPSALMVCLKWWTFELLILLAGLLPNSKLETSVLSICISFANTHFCLQYGLGAAARCYSTRVSNELESGNPQAARAVVQMVLFVSAIEAVIASTILFGCRKFFGYAFSNDKEIVNYLAEMSPFLCPSIITDSLIAELCGIVRGCGWQRIGVFISLSAYCFIGIPLSVVLCFVLHLRAKGLWIGLLTGCSEEVALLAIATAATNWQKQATMAR